MSDTAVLAAASTANITPGAGIAMGGYGARVGVASGLNDPLLVRTLLLSEGAPDTSLVIAVCDLVGVSYGLVRRARDIIAEECGIPPERVLISATHTHSGPAGVTERAAPDFVASTARTIAGSVLVAQRALAPARLKVGTASVSTISQNRRHPDGPIQTTAHVLLAEPIESDGRAPIATLVNYACHSTVFEHDNLHWSADFPGAMARAIEREVGGTAIYLQGAAGDINPVWMRHDPAEVERVGGILAAAATRVVHELRPIDAGQWCINLNWSEEVAVAPAPHGALVAGAGLRGARTSVELPRRPLPAVDAIQADLDDLVHQIKTESDREVRRRLVALRNERSIELQFARVAGRRDVERLDLQAFRIGDGVGLVSLPGEFFVAIGQELDRRAGLQRLFIAGYANGMVGYVPTADAFEHAGYEVGSAQFEPDAGAIVVDASLALLRSVM
jgi:hypothetical protein